NDGKISVVASGRKKAINQFRTILKNEAPKRVRVKNVIEKERKSPIKIGFEIIQETPDTKKTITKTSEINKQHEYNTDYFEKESIQQDTTKDGYFPVVLDNMKPEISKTRKGAKKN